MEHVESEALKYVDWFNNRRIHESLDYVPPVEFEVPYYALSESDRQSGRFGNELVSSKPVAIQFAIAGVLSHSVSNNDAIVLHGLRTDRLTSRFED